MTSEQAGASKGDSMLERSFEVSVEDDEPYARFYGVHGRVIRGRRLVGPHMGDGPDKLFQNALIPTGVVDVLELINKTIAGDVDKGNGDRVAMICLDPLLAVHLFLGGDLTEDHCRKATTYEDFVSIPGFMCGDRQLMLRVYSAPKHQLYTADRDGIVIP